MASGMAAIVVMGVTACGKSTVAEAIAGVIGGRHIEGDLFHSAANISKMRAGVALDDTDRSDWLEQLGAVMAEAVAAGEQPVLSCSALKRRYRDQLRAAVPALGFVFLDINEAEVRRRAGLRKGHFMAAGLVTSQFATLERPDEEAHVLVVDATLPVDDISRRVAGWWGIHRVDADGTG